MYKKYQRGELSLFWTAVFVGVITVVGVGALFSMRHERNFFAEAARRIMHTDAGQGLQQARHTVAKAVKPESGAIRKCVTEGKVTYSNVECDSANPGSSKVELHDTQGIEAPKVAATPETSAPQTWQDKMIEKVVQR